jgi:hypothetical protein
MKMKSLVISRFVAIISIVTMLALAFLVLPTTSAATYFFEDGFETGDFSLWSDLGDTPTVTSGEAHSGTYKAVFDAAGQFSQIDIDPADDAYMRVYVKFNSFPAEAGIWTVFGFYSELSDVYMAQVNIVYDGVTTMKWMLDYYDGVAHQYALSEQQQPSLGTWYCVELEAKTNTVTDAKYRLYVEDTELTDISQTGKNNPYQIDMGYLWSNVAASRWYDDVVIDSKFIGPIGAPIASTGVATSVSTSGATLHGQVNANGQGTTVTFQYGQTTAYGTTVSAGTVTGSADTAVSAVISSLSPNTTYHFRVVAHNSNGTVYGQDASFTTAATLVVSGPASVTYGSTGTITTSGGSGTGAMSYSAGASTGCSVNTSTGVITISNVSGTCNVTATKAADGTYSAQTSTPRAITLNKLAVTLSGNRTYNGTTSAAAAILTITNKVDTDNVSVASGSATLASANAGVQSINSMGTLALGGSKAGNYTLTGATGSVMINALAVTLSGSRTYDGSTAAVAAILTISNKVDDDDVSVASGSATLASADVGSRSITSMGTLALGGSEADNYTLTGATGMVTITQADQVPLIITGPASIAHGSTGTITTSGGSGTGAMSYSAGVSTGCTVDASTGIITVINTFGTCKVTATKAADMNYNAATSPEFTVNLNPIFIVLPFIVH